MRKFRCWFLGLWENFREFKKSHGLKIPGCSAGVGGTSMHCEGSTTLPASHGLPCPPLQQREFPSSEVCLLFTWEKLSLTGRNGSVLPVCAAHWVFHMRSFFQRLPKNQCSCSLQRFASFIRFRSKVLWVEFWSTCEGDCCCMCWTDIFYIIALE